MNIDDGDTTSLAEDTANGVHITNDGFGVAREWFGNIVVVTVSGDVDMLTAPEVAEAIENAVRENPAALIVDLSAVTFLAAAGMTLLVTAHRDVAHARRFGVVADGAVTDRPLRKLGLDKIFALYPTLDEALNDCR